MRRKGVHYSPETEFKKGIRHSPATEFKKGNEPFNRGLHPLEYMSAESYEKCRKTQFEKGNIPPQTNPKGTVTSCKHLDKKGRVHYDWYINIDWKGNRKQHNNYRRYLWEVEHQQDAPNGSIFTTYSGDDSKKPTIEDIEIIDRAELARRNYRPRGV